jgi:hypothetical protein
VGGGTSTATSNDRGSDQGSGLATLGAPPAPLGFMQWVDRPAIAATPGEATVIPTAGRQSAPATGTMGAAPEKHVVPDLKSPQ